MSLSKHRSIPSYDFPEAILSEILKRLPVKYVLRCQAVQKSWYHLIKTPMFISLHCIYHKMTAHVNPKYLLFNYRSPRLYTVRSDDAQSEEYCTIVYPLDLPPNAWSAQSNGLICVSTMFDEALGYSPKIYIWNPLVQKFKIAPESPLPRFSFEETNWKALAFGFLPEINDYVVVHVVKPSSTSAPEYDFEPYSTEDPYEQYPHSVMIGVYSLNTNSWKKICQDKVFVDHMCTNKSVFVNGIAFWVGYNCDMQCQLVMFFDTKTNILGHVTVPSLAICHFRQLERPLILPFGQSVAYFVEGDVTDWDDYDYEDDDYGSPHLDIWVLKGEMINELSWEKKMCFRLSENVRARVLGTRNNGEPILAKSNNLISCNLDTLEPHDFIESCDRLTPRYHHKEGSRPPFVIHPFVETLKLLDV
ncbi:hypothetical protein POM88_037886 [Heracleum sosnowskyi]|uniref:F-box domain-containing protein n=1 Tax=Heracleum sosnowskyi TaxID=360622 RepID=A0AAD8MGC0_9APIA|nr:hypothetical protein POM88_037886 [Heracleum sosnowskyi]